MTNPMAGLPSVDRLLNSSMFSSLVETYGRRAVTEGVRGQLDRMRQEWRKTADQSNATVGADDNLIEDIVSATTTALENRFAPSLVPVINLTGVVIHTNLGRAPYPQEAIDAMAQVAAGNSNLEYDLIAGRRGQRDSHVTPWICELTGAQDALVVNNNAAAVMLCLNTLALGKKVLVSRGELIEIGGSFRMPQIMSQSGTRLKEVGTTNRTHLADFEGAIGKKTAAIMKVHTSNYEVQGFTHEVDPHDLAQLAKQHQLPFIDDLGSGNLISLEHYGLPKERTVNDALTQGASLVTFSGDKLLGGPQCGIVAGDADLIARLRKNPMKRALRLDKVTLAALESVLRLYATPEKLIERLPVLRALTRPVTEIEAVGALLTPILSQRLSEQYTVDLEACESEIGSGALPTQRIKSTAVVCRPLQRTKDQSKKKKTDRFTADGLAERFRRLPQPVIARVNDGALWLDCRTLFDPTLITNQLDSL